MGTVLIKAPPRSKSNKPQTRGDGHPASPGYVLHEPEAFLLRVVVLLGKPKRLMLLRDREVRFAMTASVSCDVSDVKRTVPDELVVLIWAAGARVVAFAS